MVPTTKVLTVPCLTFEFKTVDQSNKRSNKRLIEQSNEVIDDPVLQFRQCPFQRLEALQALYLAYGAFSPAAVVIDLFLHPL